MDATDRGLDAQSGGVGDGVSSASAAARGAWVQVRRVGGGDAVALGRRDVGDARVERGDGRHHRGGDELSCE